MSFENLVAKMSGQFRDCDETKSKLEKNLQKPSEPRLVLDKILHFLLRKNTKQMLSGTNGENLIPIDILKSIETAPQDGNPKDHDPDIVTFKSPTNLPEDELRRLIHEISPLYGPEEISFPSPLEKVLYLAHLENPDIYPMPEYKHSCPEIDKRLMGAVPHSNFVDTSRAGLAMLMAKAFEYARRSADKYVGANNQIDFSKIDAQTKKFIEDFGLISCIPIMSRATLFDFAHEHNLNLFSIGGSSIAESFYASCRIFGNQDLSMQISSLAGGGWLTNDDREGTSKLTSKFVGYMRRNYKEIFQLLLYEETPNALKQYLQEKYPSNQYPHVQLLADIMMEMVHKFTLLPDDREEREKEWSKKAYGHEGGLEEISRKDVSEIVTSRKPEDERPLPPMPWQAFVLHPHTRYDEDGNVIAQFSTMEQLVEAAKLIKKYYPNAIVYIPTDEQGNPDGYNIKLERKVKRGHTVSATTARLAFIAHLSTSADVQACLK